MRQVLALAAFALAFPAGSIASAQVGSDIRYVSAAEVDVRSGPSDNPEFYPTNRLHRGDPVEVVEEMPGGWLRIRPPQGSFSYISTRFLAHISPNQPNYVVTSEEGGTPVYIGSSLIPDRRPTVIGVKLKRGAQVYSQGVVHTDAEGAFLPIDAPAGETRFIRATAIAKTPPLPGLSGSASTPARSTFTATGPLQPSNAPSANPPATPETLWQNAQQAERNGQTNEAIRLYTLVCTQAAQSNPNLANMARQRANYLQGGHQDYGAAAGVVAVPAVGGAAPLAGEADSGVRLSPPPGARSTWIDGTNVSSPAHPPAAAAAPSRALPAGWVSFKGRLRSAGRAIEGQKTFVLEMEENGCVRPMAYTTGTAGIDLTPWVGHIVEVQGPALYRGDIRTNYITAMRVMPQP
jgi:hypothetical protein